jgi:ubiquitin carboxyl-terminal hydrolase 1
MPRSYFPNPHDPLPAPPDLNAPSSHYPLREHQDAQELFQLILEYIKKEATTVDREGTHDLSFGSLASLSSVATTATMATTSVDVSKGVFAA